MGQFKKLELQLAPDAGAPNPILLQTDYSAALPFDARQYRDNGTPSKVVGNAIVQSEKCRLTTFGFHNDEASDGIPRFKDLSYGAYKVLGGPWIQEVVGLNEYSFPDTPYLENARHFVFVFHDSTLLGSGLVRVSSAPLPVVRQADYCAPQHDPSPSVGRFARIVPEAIHSRFRSPEN